jgi:hypothetical protein
MARITASVVSPSSTRWNIACRFAVVRCIRPSPVSLDGAQVAAFAVHIAAALATSRKRCSDSLAARASTWASSPTKPSARSARSEGRGCGGRTACPTPSEATKRIFSSPCSAASRGFDTWPSCVWDARLPGERPA